MSHESLEKHMGLMEQQAPLLGCRCRRSRFPQSSGHAPALSTGLSGWSMKINSLAMTVTPKVNRL